MKASEKLTARRNHNQVSYQLCNNSNCKLCQVCSINKFRTTTIHLHRPHQFRQSTFISKLTRLHRLIWLILNNRVRKFRRLTLAAPTRKPWESEAWAEEYFNKAADIVRLKTKVNLQRKRWQPLMLKMLSNNYNIISS